MKIKIQNYAMIWIILIILLEFGNCKQKINKYGNTDFHPHLNPASRQTTKIVMADGGLNARDVPSLEGKVAFLIPKYSMIEPTEEVGEEIEIKDKKGKWAKVQFGDKTGYVFGGYLVNAIIEGSEKNNEGSYYFIFYSTPAQGNTELTDCMNNYMQAGCLVVVYKASNDQPVNAFTDTVVNGWIDKDHLATSWSIGDAGYGGDGIKSINIHTKDSYDIYRRDSQMKMGEGDGIEESDRLCLKSYCFDLKKNPDVIAQIKSTKGLKLFEVGQYQAVNNEYATEIQLGQNDTIVFFPGKNVVMRK